MNWLKLDYPRSAYSFPFRTNLKNNLEIKMSGGKEDGAYKSRALWC